MLFHHVLYAHVPFCTDQSSLPFFLPDSSPWESVVPFGPTCLQCLERLSPGNKRESGGNKRRGGLKQRNAGVTRRGGFQNITLFTVGLFILHFILISHCLCTFPLFHICRVTHKDRYNSVANYVKITVRPHSSI